MYHCTVDLLFDWFGISCMTTDNFCFHLQNRLLQTSQTGGQQYSDTSPFSIPWVRVPWLYYDISYSVLAFSTQLVYHPALRRCNALKTWWDRNFEREKIQLLLLNYCFGHVPEAYTVNVLWSYLHPSLAFTGKDRDLQTPLYGQAHSPARKC